MLGLTAAPPPSPHGDCPSGILNGEDLPPPLDAPPSPSAAGVSSPATSARPTSSLQPSLSAQNKRSAAATNDPNQETSHHQHERPAKALPVKVVAAPTNGKSRDPSQDQRKRPAKTLPKKRVKTPVVLPVVGSPGVNLILSQGSPRTIGVKRSSPTPSQFSDDSTLKNDQGTSSVATIDNPWEQWNKQVQEEQQNRAKLTELIIYLKDAVHPQEEGFDILCWWSANAHKYPIISRIAKDVLAAPVSTVASESAFSTGGRILSDYRSHMIGSTVEALICLQDWLRPPGTTHVNTITSDVVYAKRADIYGSSDDIFEH